MSITIFLEPVREQLKGVEALMLAQADGHHPDLQAALAHLISAGGKRVRPALVLLVGGMLGGDPQRLLTFAAAVEMLHTATLVHDDLIDGALLRRGMPTLNAQWSPAATVLTGDFMFARSATLAAATDSVRVMRMFAETLATIVSGEVSQLFDGPGSTDREMYYRRIYAKTASLFELATTAAAVLSDVEEEVVQAMRRFGYALGMAFQIVDDILDFTGDQVRVGKPLGSDLRNGIVTLPVLYYAEEHPEDEAIAYLHRGETIPDRMLEGLLERIRASEAIAQAAEEARGMVSQAERELVSFPDTPQRAALLALGRYIVDRDF